VASWTGAEVVRSIPQGNRGDGSSTRPAATVEGERIKLHFSPLQLGLVLVGLCLAVFVASHPERQGIYRHFIEQAQAWLDGQTSIPAPNYQDVMPVLDSAGQPTGRGIIPFPPAPALVLLPFVYVWHIATNQQLLAAIFGAIDVGIAYWMLGYLPIRSELRWLTALFLGMGTVLWYAAAIGSTWFWAHVVAVGCLLLSIGLALSADREAAEPRPVGEVGAAVRPAWPGGLATVVLAGLGGALVVVLFEFAGDGAAPTMLVAVGVLLGIVAAGLAVAAAGRPGVVAPLVVLVGGGGGVVAILLLAARNDTAEAVARASVFGLLATLVLLAGLAPDLLRRGTRACADALSSPEARQVAAGLFFGLAVDARLTIVFGLPFFLLVGGGGSWLRRGLLAGVGAAIPIVALLVYTYAATGDLFNPAYDYIYRKEIGDYGWVFGYHAGWSIEDLRYVPQSLGTFLFGLPDYHPTTYSIYPGVGGDQLCVADQARGLFDRTCPIAMPKATGMSVFLTSPAYLLAPLAFLTALRRKLDRATVGATIAVVAIAFVNLMHFSQGWVQFGYRFSNDFAPFALILVALGASRLGRYWAVAAIPLVAASIVINWWGVTWGAMLGW
jgi:hypothetical protein